MASINIGVGASFPIMITDKGSVSGWYPVEQDVSLIENNLRSLIEYSIGQRFRQEDFGTRLLECIEEPNSQALEYLVKSFLKEAIRKYEKRLHIKRIITTRYNQYLQIIMEYSLTGLVNDLSMTITYNRITNTLTI